MTINDELQPLTRALDTEQANLARLDKYWQGTQPAAFMAPDARKALGNRLSSTAVNYPRMIVRSRAERLHVTGFRTEGPDAKPDAALWSDWRRCHMTEGSGMAHVDALLFGRSYAVVWADSTGAPTISVESPSQMVAEFDPLTREVRRAFKRWVDPMAQRGFGVLYEPEKITRLTADARAGDPAALGATSWTVAEVIANPLGVVPVVQVTNAGRLLELLGVSEIADALPLVDALAKLLNDAMVSSEFFARPRRWATGIEIAEDDDGNPISPFSDAPERVWMAEGDNVKFGEFSPASLSGYTDLAALLTGQIASVGNLPPHYVSANAEQPASADAIRSSESSLVARCYELQATFGRGWADVAKLMLAVRTGADPRSLDVETVWASPETRTVAQDVDATSKMVGLGLPLALAAEELLHWSPAQVERLRVAVRQAAIDAAVVPATVAPAALPRRTEVGDDDV